MPHTLETREDRKHEDTMQTHFEKHLGWSFEVMPRYHTVDRAIVDFDSEGSRVIGWLEYKHRQVHAGVYPTVMFQVAKTTAHYNLGLLTGLPSYLVVSFTGDYDGDKERSYYLCEITTQILQESRIVVTGRTDRGWETDVQPMYFIPMEKFDRIPDDDQLELII